MATGKSFVPLIDISELTVRADLDFTQPELRKVCLDIVEAFETSGFACLTGHALVHRNYLMSMILSVTSESHVCLGCLGSFVSKRLPISNCAVLQINPLQRVSCTHSPVIGRRPQISNLIKIDMNPIYRLSDFGVNCDDEGKKMVALDSMTTARLHNWPGEVELAFSKSEEFFAQNRDSKSLYARERNCNQGWVGTGVESLNPQRPGDFKEAFNLTINQHEKVMTPEGDWWRPPHVPGSVLVNIGDLMQRWTSDRLKSTVHRVTFPVDDVLKQRSRRSMAFFVHPNDNWLVRGLDGCDKYAPITALDYLNMRFQETYKY
ncbi:hypothetical protein CAPTEDRAFT_219759 [Capitella teleta]|uniref:Isopenicillin N synthase-like Fe(2+) 2OG dioxygenase domain-containing protein n=1 Tax=Capitella teleta TaxID=283909 RepID=R7UFC9_CAPTE|nr:hypothetical protein CAPTEDRAFT_219759 [Capitella teleta]|eukprot:ELU04925.1 hypothetical protein CAPTEDRAFT_219759 [Capitella teleta]